MRDGSINAYTVLMRTTTVRDTLVYQVCDLGTPLPALCDTAIVTINAVNDAPMANMDEATTNEDTPVTIPILSNGTDVDGGIDPSSVTM